MQIAFLLFPGITQLDLTGPVQFLSRLPDARIDLVWEASTRCRPTLGFQSCPLPPLRRCRVPMCCACQAGWAWPR